MLAVLVVEEAMDSESAFDGLREREVRSSKLEVFARKPSMVTVDGSVLTLSLVGRRSYRGA